MVIHTLLIDDDILFQQQIVSQLAIECDFDICQTAKEGLHKAATTPYDLFLLDDTLPDMCHVELIRRLRSEYQVLPIFLLGANDNVDERLRVYEAGVTGFIPKPCNFQELSVRIKAAIKFVNTIPHQLKEDIHLTLDPISRTVIREGQEIQLRKKEFEILQYMVRNAGKVVTRDVLIDHLWSNETESYSNMIDVHFNYLRKKLDKPFAKKLLHTVHGVGYILREKNDSK